MLAATRVAAPCRKPEFDTMQTLEMGIQARGIPCEVVHGAISLNFLACCTNGSASRIARNVSTGK
jgi:hypothetical protein